MKKEMRVIPKSVGMISSSLFARYPGIRAPVPGGAAAAV
jgi:hypothetical protein